MRPIPNKLVEKFRATDIREWGDRASTSAYGNNGIFMVPYPGHRAMIRCICSDGLGWEHVSVSLEVRIPTWQEMCYVKELFWDDEETVMQLHPPKSEWINNHPYVLHLWRPGGPDAIPGLEIPRPAGILVGIKGRDPHHPGRKGGNGRD